MLVAFDFGLTNTDIVMSKSNENDFHSFPTMEVNDEFISYIFDSININVNQVSQIAVTGGKSSDLDDNFNDIPIKKVNEEAGETSISAVSKDGRIEEEAADLIYHLLVLLYDAGSNLNEVIKVLENRAEI